MTVSYEVSPELRVNQCVGGGVCLQEKATTIDPSSHSLSLFLFRQPPHTFATLKMQDGKFKVAFQSDAQIIAPGIQEPYLASCFYATPQHGVISTI